MQVVQVAFHVLAVLVVVAVLASAITVLDVLVVLIVIIVQAVIVALDVLIVAEIVIVNAIQTISHCFLYFVTLLFISSTNIYKLFINCLNNIVNCKFDNLYIYCNYYKLCNYRNNHYSNVHDMVYGI